MYRDKKKMSTDQKYGPDGKAFCYSLTTAVLGSLKGSFAIKKPILVWASSYDSFILGVIG